jgi:hypothetical protein
LWTAEWDRERRPRSEALHPNSPRRIAEFAPHTCRLHPGCKDLRTNSNLPRCYLTGGIIRAPKREHGRGLRVRHSRRTRVSARLGRARFARQAGSIRIYLLAARPPGQSPARKIEFCKAFQADLACPNLRAKIFFFLFFRNMIYLRRPGPIRGAYRERHIRWAGDAVDARASGAW